MRISLSHISLSSAKARANKLAKRFEAVSSRDQWDVLAARLASGRHERGGPPIMTPQAFKTWSEALREKVRGTENAPLAERIITARQRINLQAEERAARGPVGEHAAGIKPTDASASRQETLSLSTRVKR